MSRSKKLDLTKKTLNFRPGDFEKMGELFPDIGASVAIRGIVSRFVDKHYTEMRPDVEDSAPEADL